MKISLKESKKLIFDSTKAFITKRHPKGDIFFVINCKKILVYDENRLNIFELVLEPVIIDAPQEISEVVGKKQYKWRLTIKKELLDSKPKANFSYLEIDSNLYSCGIGSVMFNMLIKEGWNSFSDAEAKLLLREDIDRENTRRKEKFYKKFGLKIDYDDSEHANGYARILSFYNLNVYDKFENIESIDISDEFLLKLNKIKDLSYENSNLKHSNKSLSVAYKKCDDKYMICSKFVILIGFVVLCVCVTVKINI